MCLYFVKQLQRRVFGDFCQCDNFNCPKDDRGRICGGEVMIRRVSRFGVQSNLVNHRTTRVYPVKPQFNRLNHFRTAKKDGSDGVLLQTAVVPCWSRPPFQ